MGLVRDSSAAVAAERQGKNAKQLITDWIDGQSQAKGTRIPLSDLLIGVTALEMGYRIATHKVPSLQTHSRHQHRPALKK